MKAEIQKLILEAEQVLMELQYGIGVLERAGEPVQEAKAEYLRVKERIDKLRKAM